MKFSYKKLFFFIILLTFFTPDGMTTIGNQNYIQNATFLNNSVIKICISLMYWTRNLVGISCCILQAMLILKNKVKCSSSYTVAGAFALFALWIIIDAYLNNIGLYQVIIHMAYCLGYVLLAERSMKNGSTQYFDCLLLISKLLLLINLALILPYRNGITTGKDYISTAYYFLGTKNQVTPLLIMASMLIFMSYGRKRNLVELLFNETVVLLNAFLMGSGTGKVCVMVIIIGNIVQQRNVKRYANRVSNKRNLRYMYILIASLAILVGIVFFNIQSIFGWLIVDVLNKDLTLSGRTDTWKLAMEQFLCKPLIGYGYGHMVVGHYYAHNIILELLVTSGLVGFVLYSLFVFKIFRKYFKKHENNYTVPVIYAVIALIIANIGEAFIFNIAQLTVFMLVVYAQKQMKE